MGGKQALYSVFASNLGAEALFSMVFVSLSPCTEFCIVVSQLLPRDLLEFKAICNMWKYFFSEQEINTELSPTCLIARMSAMFKNLVL